MPYCIKGFQENLAEKPELLMMGMSALTYRVGNRVIKTINVWEEQPGITKDNILATRNEANIFLILRSHPRIVECISVDPALGYIELRYYPDGNLRDHVAKYRDKISEADTRRWARQMIEGVEYIHTMGVRHSDLRLDQWLLDPDMNARLTDFNGSGFDGEPSLGISGSKAVGVEVTSHYLPRDPCPDNTTTSDLFALGSCLYELLAGERPYHGVNDEAIDALYRNSTFPPVEHLWLGKIIIGFWKTEFASAQDAIQRAEQLYEL